MTAQNAKDTTITFGGNTIGGLVQWSLQEGRVRESTWRPLNGEPVSRATKPDYGNCTLTLYYDESDAGQAAMLSSLRNSTSATVVVTHSGGTETFTALCTLFPIAGSISSAEPVQRSRVQLRVSGYVTHADP